MKSYFILGCLLLVGLIPLTGRTESGVSVTASVLHDHFAGELSPGVQAWVAEEAAQMAVTGQYNATALTLDIQSRFHGQKVGAPEVQALTLVILVQAIRSAETTLTNSETQLAQIEAARAAVARAKVTHPQIISQDTVPNRSVLVSGAPVQLPTNPPAADPRMEGRYYREFLAAQAAFKRLPDDLKYYQSQATEMINARLAELK